MIKHFVLILLSCLLLTMTGCVTKDEMQTLQIERQQDVNRIQQLEAELAESKKALRQEIENSQSPVREKTADTWAELQSLRADFAKLRGDLETLNMRMDRQIGDANAPLTMADLQKELKEVEFILENQLQADLSSLKPNSTPLAEAGATPVDTAADNATAAAPQTQKVEVGKPTNETAKATPAAPVQTTDAAKALYDKAYNLYKQGEFEKARSYWAEFTDTFKKHAYVPSAVFWQGQCYYKLGDHARAVILYEDVIDKYPKSSKYKSALLMAAYSWNKLGKPELAKMRLDEVIKKFPGTPQATQAKRTLDKMK
ncbi:tetratricopeptide repeat protein [Pseudodesulfovibrio sp.]|uniref:tetratricopeptide repeat protein n=1 Tax=unclassified Pseudodesulfovibrio TaxID=2661612 RepID=UPI003AFFB709